jgi:hypothetical protein
MAKINPGNAYTLSMMRLMNLSITPPVCDENKPSGTPISKQTITDNTAT